MPPANHRFVLLFCCLYLLPILLLLFAIQRHQVAIEIAEDVTASDSLRYRCLWVHHSTQEAPEAVWRPAVVEMQAIYARLLHRYPDQMTEADTWDELIQSLDKDAWIGWETANRFQEAMHRQTSLLAGRLRQENLSFTLCLCAGILGLAAALWRGMNTIRSFRAEQSLAESEHRFQTVVTHLQEVIFQTDRNGRWTYLNPAWETLTGYTVAESLGRPLSDFVCPDDGAEAGLTAGQEPQQNNSEASPSEIRLRTKTGGFRWVRILPPLLSNVEGYSSSGWGTLHDITERKAAEETAQECIEQFQSVISSMEEGLVLIDEKETIVLCNESAGKIFEVAPEQICDRQIGMGGYTILHEDGSPYSQKEYPILVSLHKGQTLKNCILGLKKEGRCRWISINAMPLFRPGQTKPYAAFATFVDITEPRWFEEQVALQIDQVTQYSRELAEHQMELAIANERLKALATTDGLTGLKNHRTFQEFLEEAFQQAQRENTALSVILLDVDRFKLYNDTFGHPAGDEVLKTVAQTLLSLTPPNALAARYGGEEFTLVLRGKDMESAFALAETLRTAIEQTDILSAPWPGRAVTASFGVATHTPQTTDRAQLIAEADTALYASKQNGRNRVTHYRETLIVQRATQTTEAPTEQKERTAARERVAEEKTVEVLPAA